MGGSSRVLFTRGVFNPSRCSIRSADRKNGELPRRNRIESSNGVESQLCVPRRDRILFSTFVQFSIRCKIGSLIRLRSKRGGGAINREKLNERRRVSLASGWMRRRGKWSVGLERVENTSREGDGRKGRRGSRSVSWLMAARPCPPSPLPRSFESR